jgi:hypothetical protein
MTQLPTETEAKADLARHHAEWVAGVLHEGEALDELLEEVLREVERQDEKHGPFEGTPLGRSRLALACMQDEIAEALEAWRYERLEPNWPDTRNEVLQVAAVAVRAIRDAFVPSVPAVSGDPE